MTRAFVIGLVLVAGCGPGAAPPATSVTVPTVVPTTPVQVDPSTLPAPNAPSPFELAISEVEVCVRIEGRVHCAHGFETDTSIATVPPKGNVEDATSVALGRGFGCLTRATGEVKCWGENQRGQLGARSRVDRSEAPMSVVGITSAKRVVAANGQACAILRDETVTCWGENRFGQTAGDTTYTDAARELVVPTPVANVTGAQTLAMSTTTSCATTRDHGVACWGLDHFGDPTDIKNQRPREIGALAGFDDIAAAGTAFCGVKQGEPWCWGESYSLLPEFRGRANKPMPVKVVGRARRVRVGESHACALMDDGRVMCWGSNWSGALGRTTTGDTWATSPAGAVENLPRAIDVYAGGGMSCARTDGHELYCWGRWALSTGAERKELAPVAMRID